MAKSAFFCIILLGSESNLSAQVNAEQVMTIGRNVMSMDDYLLAIQYFNLAIKAKPYLSDAYYLRGLAKLQLDDYEGAIADCSTAIQRNKFKTEAYKVRGFARQHLGLDSLAIDDYNVGLNYNPDDKYFLFYKAIALSEIENYDEADSTFNILLRRNPKFDDGYVARGRMNILCGDTAKAFSDLNRALEINRTQIPAYLMKADIFAGQKKWHEALSSIDEAIRLQPDNLDLYINRAYLRYNIKDFFGAMADYDYTLSIEPENTTALFNRALLRTEVKALSDAIDDFSNILKRDPANFYAIYNRGLIYLEIANYKNALDDFREIAKKYPRFHLAYYAMADCWRNLGNIREMLINVKKADQLVAAYVANPSRNPLDRPTIAAGKTHTNSQSSANETEEEFMERFNQLITASTAEQPELAFNDRIKGRVQDRDIKVGPENSFALSFYPPERSLRETPNYFRNLDNINRSRYLSRKLYINSHPLLSSESTSVAQCFAIEQEYTNSIASTDNPRPIDLLARGVARTMLKNYDAAIIDITRAMEGADDFTTAMFARAYTYLQSGKPQLAMIDLDNILEIDPDMLYAWYNKGNIYYENGDFTSALKAFDKAISINPDFAEAYYNRGLTYIRLGRKENAFADLSKAGELGILQAYNVLKRMK
ncbi:MAG: tetratricopeptide repeat protein [Muribaculaceae bacterium]|nr:tetratricopeptide repeat protein [Muribaculaceae bacterium]